MKLTNNLYFYPEQGFLDCNTYVITGNPGIIIDPGATMSLSAKVDGLRKDDIDPKNIGIIVNTHLHGDHCGANEAFKQLSGARITIHPVQKSFYSVSVLEVAEFFGLPPAQFKEDVCLDGESLSAGDTEFELIKSPGHSPDCICYYSREAKILLCGDVIFNENIGRADLPGGNASDLKKSIEKLSRLDIEFLLPGHMDIVAGSQNVRHNFDFIKGSILGWL